MKCIPPKEEKPKEGEDFQALGWIAKLQTSKKGPKENRKRSGGRER